jgi:hypothetical protein
MSVDIIARLFREFAARRHECVFAILYFTFGQHPRAVILAAPEWSAGMDKKNFQAVQAAKQQETGADFVFQG